MNDKPAGQRATIPGEPGGCDDGSDIGPVYGVAGATKLLQRRASDVIPGNISLGLNDEPATIRSDSNYVCAEITGFPGNVCLRTASSMIAGGDARLNGADLRDEGLNPLGRTHIAREVLPVRIGVRWHLPILHVNRLAPGARSPGSATTAPAAGCSVSVPADADRQRQTTRTNEQ